MQRVNKTMNIGSMLTYLRTKGKEYRDKAINTLVWLRLGNNKAIVLNVWLIHRNKMMRPTNIGDDLNWVIMRYLQDKEVICYRYSFLSIFHPVNYMCIGSIVDTLTNNHSIIWGSGAMYGDKNRPFIPPKKVLAVRGPRTREYLLEKGVECPNVYGDPAILLPLIYPISKIKKYKMGFIPHMVDLKERNVQRFIEDNKNDICLIDIHNYYKWEDVVELINECEFVASSSLHGIIIADAYNIPNIWITLSNRVKGNGFKFYDYFEGCGRKVEKPLDLSNKAISFAELKERVSLYEAPQSKSVKMLLDTCPFLSEKRRLEFQSKGYM